MANVAVPSGSQYPTRSVGAQLQPFASEIRSLQANQGSQRYEALNEISQSIPDSIYSPNETASLYNPTQDTQSPDVAVELTDIPTSSTNYARPRTVAAGYDPDTQTMTVVFRDGTFYNYYEVTQGEWINFSASFSKGKPWLNRANSKQGSDGLFIGKPRGVADPSTMSAELRQALWRVSSTQQRSQKPLRSMTNPSKVAGYAAKAGKNPSRGGINPATRKRKP